MSLVSNPPSSSTPSNFFFKIFSFHFGFLLSSLLVIFENLLVPTWIKIGLRGCWKYRWSNWGGESVTAKTNP